MYNDIERIIKGLEVLAKYKPNASIYGKETARTMLVTQEEEYFNISNQDRETLYKYGWRNRKEGPYMWFLVTDRGLESEQGEPDLFK